MKKFLLGSTAGLIALGMSVPAMAADLAARPYTKAPPAMVAAIYDWSGFYIGANGGYGNSRNSWSIPGFGSEGAFDANGAVAGGQIGYRWQTGAMVFGLEAQYDWSDMSGSQVSLGFVLLRVMPLSTHMSAASACSPASSATRGITRCSM